ncbi:MAG: NIF family HAD-type phosphatase [Nitrososphaerales archaeon]
MEVPAEDLHQVLKLIEEEVNSEKFSIIWFERKIRIKGKNIPVEILDDIVKAAKNLVFPLEPVLGKFLVVTGIDKSGKETQCFNPKGIKGVLSIYDYLTKSSYKVKKFSLPSYDTNIGALIASYLKRESNIVIRGELPKDYAWILWSLDRAQYNDTIINWLKTDPKNVVLSRRWLESNVAYQKVNDIDVKRILNLEKNIIKQDYTVVIDLPADVAIKRVDKIESKKDLYEDVAFMEKVRQVFLNLQDYYPFGKTFIINGDNPPDIVNKQILDLLRELGF